MRNTGHSRHSPSLSNELGIFPVDSSCIQANIHSRQRLPLLYSMSRGCNYCTWYWYSLGHSVFRCTVADTNTVHHPLDLDCTLHAHSHKLCHTFLHKSLDSYTPDRQSLRSPHHRRRSRYRRLHPDSFHGSYRSSLTSWDRGGREVPSAAGSIVAA